MRFLLSLFLYVGILAAIGCGGKIPIQEATAEDIRMQQEAEKQVYAAESEMRKKQPKEKTFQQTVDEQERARQR